MNPNRSQLDIKDIAHALSMLCRANGHFHSFYSVGQHSLNCANEASARGYTKRVQLACLLHDASEAYLSDITRPVKQFLPMYLEIESNVQLEVWKKWLEGELSVAEAQQVSSVDDAMLYYEFLHYMDEKVFPEKPVLFSVPDFLEFPFREVSKKFLMKFNDLYDKEVNCG